MTLSSKIIAGTLFGIAISVCASLLVQRAIIRNQGIELTRNIMRTAVVEAEHVRESISSLNRRNAFNQEALLAEYKQSGDLRGSTIYNTIPVVAAWNAIAETAKKEGFEFRVPKRQARNPKNTPTPEEEKILDFLESGKAEEYFVIDTDRNEMVYARPIILSADCLTCHGDPKNSPTGDGKDLIGMTMENWRAGEMHGAFLLKASLTRVDTVVAAGMHKTLLWVLPLCILIAVCFYFLNRVAVTKPLNSSITSLNDASDQIVAAAEQVSGASQGLAEGASRQAACLEETSASLEEVSSMVRNNAAAADRAKMIANEARGFAETGTTDMAEMKAAMDDIKVASTDISKIIKSIDEIAFQTNLLALNAAVEAARAGEAGMGFAVVADEVRTLAQRSAQSAKDTAEKIEAAMVKSERGVQISLKVAANFDQIATRTRAVDQYVAEIADASREQSAALGQVNTAVTQMDKVMQGNAASAEEGAAAAEELSAQANCMRGTVGELLRMVGKQVAAAPSSDLGARRSLDRTASPAPFNASSNGVGSASLGFEGRNGSPNSTEEMAPEMVGKNFRNF